MAGICACMDLFPGAPCVLRLAATRWPLSWPQHSGLPAGRATNGIGNIESGPRRRVLAGMCVSMGLLLRRASAADGGGSLEGSKPAVLFRVWPGAGSTERYRILVMVWRVPWAMLCQGSVSPGRGDDWCWETW